MLNKNTWGVKGARPIRSNIANRQARPKGLISAEASKLLYQNIFNSLNDTKIGRENFDESLHSSNSSDFSTAKVLCYTVHTV